LQSLLRGAKRALGTVDPPPERAAVPAGDVEGGPAILALYRAGLTHADVARKLGISRDAARARLRRARAHRRFRQPRAPSRARG
jgi:hypothetical protein